MNDLNAGCAHDLSDEDTKYCNVHGYIWYCPKHCEHFENWMGKKEDKRKDVASHNSNMAL